MRDIRSGAQPPAANLRKCNCCLYKTSYKQQIYLRKSAASGCFYCISVIMLKHGWHSPGGLDGADEELTSVGVGTSVGHAQYTGLGVLEHEVLISKLGSVDALASSSIVVGEVTTLAHESWDHTVEAGSLVPKSLLSGAEGSEVLSGLWHNIGTELLRE